MYPVNCQQTNENTLQRYATTICLDIFLKALKFPNKSPAFVKSRHPTWSPSTRARPMLEPLQ